MTKIDIHSIRRHADQGSSHGWRIASASVPIAIAELTVAHEEARDLSPAHVLLLETIRLLEREGGRAKVATIAEFSGIGDEALMASIIVPLAEQGLVLIEGEIVQQNPALIIEGVDARIVVEREEQVCVMGLPPIPVYGIDLQRLKRLRAFEAEIGAIDVSEETLEGWRVAFWDARTRRLQLRETLRLREYVLEGSPTGDSGLYLCDGQNDARLDLSAEHPFMEQILGVVRPILDAVPVLLSQFGTWDADTSTLRCTGEQWRRWCAAQGRDVSEVILQSGSTYVATYVRCCPADGDSARAMLLENVIEELDSSAAPCTAERIEHFAEKQRHGDLLRVHDLPTPTLSDVEASAWDSGRWELAYRIGRAADGL